MTPAGVQPSFGGSPTRSRGRPLERAGTCRTQFAIALLFACAWTVFSVGVSRPWLSDLDLQRALVWDEQVEGV
jgi:hypothetical protein